LFSLSFLPYLSIKLVIAIITIIISFMIYIGIITQQEKKKLHIKSTFLAASQITCNSRITILIQQDWVTYGKGTNQPISEYILPAVLLHTSPLKKSELCAYMDYQTAIEIKIFELLVPSESHHHHHHTIIWSD